MACNEDILVARVTHVAKDNAHKAVGSGQKL